MNPILVTGASGFIGGNLVRDLALQKLEVVGICHPTDRVEQSGMTRIDLRNAGEVNKLFRQHKFSAVFHVAASGVSAESENLTDLIEVNTLGTALLGRAALLNGVERFVHVGSGFEYQPQATPVSESTPLGGPNLYGASKTAGWMLLDSLCRLQGLPLVTFRPFSIYGPGERPSKLIPYVILQTLLREPTRLTLATQVRDYLFVDDLIEALRLELAAPHAIGQVYNIGSGPEQGMSVRALVKKILVLMGASVTLCWFDRANRNRNEPPFLVSDPTKAHVELGWRPRVHLAEGLGRTLEWYEARIPKEVSA